MLLATNGEIRGQIKMWNRSYRDKTFFLKLHRAIIVKLGGVGWKEGIYEFYEWPPELTCNHKPYTMAAIATSLLFSEFFGSSLEEFLGKSIQEKCDQDTVDKIIHEYHKLLSNHITTN